MTLSKQTALYISIGVIAAYWLYNVVTAGAHAVLPAEFSEFAWNAMLRKILHVVVIVLLLRLAGADSADVGVYRDKWKQQLLKGLLFGLIFFVFFNAGLASVMSSLFPEPEVAGNSVMMYFHDPQNLVIWLMLGIFGGGVVEELMRIFVLTRFEKVWGKTGLYIALLFSSVVFGLGHLYQGTSGAISTGIYGLVIGLIYIRRRSAIEVMTAHAFSDVLGIVGAYLLAGHG